MVRNLNTLALLLAFAGHARANSPPAPPPAAAPAPAPAASTPHTYALRNLRPAGLTVQSLGADRRQLLQFQNEQGGQFLLVEENGSAPQIRDVASLSPFLASSSHSCSVDLECSGKAFCTGDCRNFYYELSNLPQDRIPPGRNSCTIKSFSCSREPASLPAAPAPAPAPAALNAPEPAPAKGP